VYTDEQLSEEETDANITAAMEAARIGPAADDSTNSATEDVIPREDGVATSKSAPVDTLWEAPGTILCRQRKGVAHLCHAWYGQAQQKNVGHPSFL